MLAAAGLITEHIGESWLASCHRPGPANGRRKRPVTPEPALGGITSTWLGERRVAGVPNFQASAAPFPGVAMLGGCAGGPKCF